jgi:hypothetical protein
MARVIRFHKTGGPDVLQIDEVPASCGYVCMRSVSTGRRPCFALVCIWSSQSCRAGSATRPQVRLESNEQIGKIIVTVD